MLQDPIWLKPPSSETELPFLKNTVKVPARLISFNKRGPLTLKSATAGQPHNELFNPIIYRVKCDGRTYLHDRIEVDIIALEISRTLDMYILGSDRYNLVQLFYDGTIKLTQKEQAFLNCVCLPFTGQIKMSNDRLIIVDKAFVYQQSRSKNADNTKTKAKVKCFHYPICCASVMLIWYNSQFYIHYYSHDENSFHSHCSDEIPQIPCNPLPCKKLSIEFLNIGLADTIKYPHERTQRPVFWLKFAARSDEYFVHDVIKISNEIIQIGKFQYTKYDTDRDLTFYGCLKNAIPRAKWEARSPRKCRVKVITKYINGCLKAVKYTDTMHECIANQNKSMNLSIANDPNDDEGLDSEPENEHEEEEDEEKDDESSEADSDDKSIANSEPEEEDEEEGERDDDETTEKYRFASDVKCCANSAYQVKGMFQKGFTSS